MTTYPLGRLLLAAAVVGIGVLSIIGSSPLTSENCPPDVCASPGSTTTTSRYVTDACLQSGSGTHQFQIAIKDLSTQCVPGFVTVNATSAQEAAQCTKSGYQTASTVLNADFKYFNSSGADSGTHATIASDNETGAVACVRNSCSDASNCDWRRNPDPSVDSCFQRNTSTGAYPQADISACR